MKTDLLISVIVPVYNVEKYIDRCVKSIVNQTYKNLEIILVDDGSQDSSGKKCDEWKKKDERIIVVHKINGGLSDARNTGIDLAKGSFLSFIDSDDYIDSDMYEIMIECAINTYSDIVCCGRKIVVNGEIKKEMHNCSKLHTFSYKEAIVEMLTFGCIEESACDKIYKADIFCDIRFPLGELNEDLAIMPRLFGLCGKISHCGQAFYNYCQNQGSISKSSYSPRLHVCIKHIEETEEYISKTFGQTMEKSLEVFKARYGLALSTTMLGDEKAVERYREDYNYYISILRDNFSALLLSPNFDLMAKIRCVCILLGVYPVAKKVKVFFRL